MNTEYTPLSHIEAAACKTIAPWSSRAELRKLLAPHVRLSLAAF